MSGVMLTEKIGAVAHVNLLVEGARGHMKNRRYTVANYVAKNALEIDGRDFTAQFTEARTDKYKKRYEMAIEKLEALKSRDYNGITTLEIGHIYVAQSEDAINENYKDRAIEFLNKAIEAFADLESKKCEKAALLEIARSQTMKGRIETSRGNKVKASAYFRQAGKFLDECSVGHLVTPSAIPFARGHLEQAMGNYDEAYRIFDSVTEMPQLGDETTAQLATEEIGKILYDKDAVNSFRTGEKPKYESPEDAKMDYLMKKLIARSNNQHEKNSQPYIKR